MHIDFDIESLVADAVSAALAVEKLQPIITSNVEKAVKSAIDEQFSYRAPFIEHLKKKMAEAMPTDIEDMGRFADLVLKTVSACMNDQQHQFIKQAIEPKLASMLRALPPKMKLSELVEMLTEDFKDCYERKDSSQPTFIVEHSQSSTLTDYWVLYADPNSNVSSYGCKIKARFRGEGVCWELMLDDEALQKKLIIGTTYNADALMLNLYTGGIVIELDQEDFSDVYYDDGEGN